MPDIDDSIRSTFPIPKSKIRKKKWAMGIKSPVTLAPLLTTVATSPAIIAHPLIGGGAAAVAGAGVIGYWAIKHKALDQKIIEQLVAESNKEQDNALKARVHNLHGRGHTDYALSLASFLECKQKIEKALHNDPTVTQQKEQIEKLVDRITFGASDQLKLLAEFDEKLRCSDGPLLSFAQKQNINRARHEISDRLHQAFQTLESTWTNLGEVLDPTTHLQKPDTAGDHLDQAIAELKEELTISDQIQDRISDDLDLMA
ncbi:MAG: hypothetical protein AAF226_05150 [Verrucomicrobiota bacterium]